MHAKFIDIIYRLLIKDIGIIQIHLRMY